MIRPELNQIPLAAVCLEPGSVNATMSQGQWDGLLAAIYDNGGTLIELDARERPVAAYRKQCNCDLCIAGREGRN